MVIPTASISQDLEPTSTNSPITNDVAIVFNNNDTNKSKYFKLLSNGLLKIGKSGTYVMTFNVNAYNFFTSPQTFGIYATKNNIMISSSSIDRTVTNGSLAPLTNTIQFTAKRGDLIGVAITTTGSAGVGAVSTTFRVPDGMSSQGFPSASPIVSNKWAANFYQITYMGKNC